MSEEKVTYNRHDDFTKHYFRLYAGSVNASSFTALASMTLSFLYFLFDNEYLLFASFGVSLSYLFILFDVMKLKKFCYKCLVLKISDQDYNRCKESFLKIIDEMKGDKK